MPQSRYDALSTYGCDADWLLYRFVANDVPVRGAFDLRKRPPRMFVEGLRAAMRCPTMTVAWSRQHSCWMAGYLKSPLSGKVCHRLSETYHHAWSHDGRLLEVRGVDRVPAMLFFWRFIDPVTDTFVATADLGWREIRHMVENSLFANDGVKGLARKHLAEMDAQADVQIREERGAFDYLREDFRGTRVRDAASMKQALREAEKDETEHEDEVRGSVARHLFQTAAA